MAQAPIPGSAGALLGVALGNVLAVPLLAELAETYGTTAVLIPRWVDVVVPAAALAVVAGAAFGPALRAARMPTAAVLRLGASAAGGRGLRIRGLAGRLPLPRPVTLDLAAPFARPARAASTAAAVAFGALAVTFAVGLGSTLVAVKTDGDPDKGGDVTVRTVARPDDPAPGQPGAEDGVPGAPPPGKPADPAAVAAAIAALPGTASVYRTAQTQVETAGLKGGAPLVAYEGNAAGSPHGVPLGAALHRQVMPAKGRAVGTTIPSAGIDVHGAPPPALLATAGVVIATAGALLPAGWAARAATARALRAE
ncbi:hypothetical protein ACFY8C_17310 [Streptomyces flavochromogenes]|uniref:ABC transporter permease n=1 Tax=Streptomyces flavochromogenes TaxID=68199 RepID=A0ABW6XRQ7_9ACTN